MNQKKISPMTRDAASRIASVTAGKNDGKIPTDSFASRADATVQRTQVAPMSGKSSKR